MLMFVYKIITKLMLLATYLKMNQSDDDQELKSGDVIYENTTPCILPAIYKSLDVCWNKIMKKHQ